MSKLIYAVHISTSDRLAMRVQLHMPNGAVVEGMSEVRVVPGSHGAVSRVHLEFLDHECRFVDDVNDIPIPELRNTHDS